MIAIKTRTVGALTVAAIFGGIALSAALGLWKTTNTKEPIAIKSGEFAGMPNPSDIRGSYTWADVGAAFSIPVGSLIAAFGGSGPDEKVNSLEARYADKLPAGAELGTDSVRLFAALYAGLPHEAEADTVLPAQAIPVLRAEGKAAAALIDAAAARAYGAAPMVAAAAAPAPAQELSVPSSAPAAPVAAVQKPAEPAAAPAQEHAPAAGSVTGKTTFGDLKDWGLDMDKVSEMLGGLGPAAQAVKDYCSAKGLTFSEIKPRLEALAGK
jgi:hypothetical protein